MNENIFFLIISQLLVTFIVGMMLTIIFYTREMPLIMTKLIPLPGVIFLKGIKAQIVAFLFLIPFSFMIYIFWVQNLLSITWSIIGFIAGIYFAFYLKKHPIA